MAPRITLALALTLPLLLAGCTTVSYYGQAIGGHFDLLARARPVEDWLAEPDLEPRLRERLSYAREAREFASRELGLPDNGSYRSYADLGRPFVVWNVFAAPELSLTPREWCFPVAGCVSYRGFFSQARAEEFARELAAQGFDVYVAGVAAYSTLGWFDDPLTNAMLNRPLPEIAGLVFHELVHQRLYVKNDTTFNESLATVVELEGIRRWLDAKGVAGQFTDFQSRIETRERFNRFLLDARRQLEALYASSISDDEKRAGKKTVFDNLRRDYATLDFGKSYDRWMSQALGNAHLASVGLYHGQVEALRSMLVRHRGDFRAFFAEAEKLSALPASIRTAKLSEDRRGTQQ